MATLKLISLGCDSCGVDGPVQAYFNNTMVGQVDLDCPQTKSYPAGTTENFVMSQPIWFHNPGGTGAASGFSAGPYISTNPTGGTATWTGGALGCNFTLKYQVT